MAVFACSDLHGRLDLFKQMCNSLGENDILYVIGDIFDRGPHGWEIYKMIKEDPRITLMCGNHEYMAANGLEEWFVNGMGFEAWNLWTYYNGGQVTFDAILSDIGCGEIPTLVKELNELPVICHYTNTNGVRITLVHSGCISNWKEDCVWDRRNLHQTIWRGTNDEMIIHGHTPIDLMIEDWETNNLFKKDIEAYKEDPGGALYWCSNHKICLDTGAVWTNYAVMLNLDTFDEHIFTTEV